MAPRLSKICLALLGSLMLADGRRGFVDRRRELQDVNMEEEVGAFGHEQTVIIAHEEDSTSAKATSRVHNVDDQDSKKAVHETTNIKESWTQEEIDKHNEDMKKA